MSNLQTAEARRGVAALFVALPLSAAVLLATLAMLSFIV